MVLLYMDARYDFDAWMSDAVCLLTLILACSQFCTQASLLERPMLVHIGV